MVLICHATKGIHVTLALVPTFDFFSTNLPTLSVIATRDVYTPGVLLDTEVTTNTF